MALQQVGCVTEEALMVGKHLQTAQFPWVPHLTHCLDILYPVFSSQVDNEDFFFCS